MKQLSRCFELGVVGDRLIDGFDQPTDKDAFAGVTALREIGSSDKRQLLDVLDTRVGCKCLVPVDDI